VLFLVESKIMSRIEESEKHLRESFEKIERKHIEYFSHKPPRRPNDKHDTIHAYYYFVTGQAYKKDPPFYELPEDIQKEMIAVYPTMEL